MLPPLALDRDVQVPTDQLAPRAQRGDVLVALHELLPISAYGDSLIVLDQALLVLFGALVEALRTFLVLEADFIESIPARRALAPPDGHRIVGRQRVGGRVMRVGGAAEDDRLVGISGDEAHQHLLADSRHSPKPEPRACLALADADPTGPVTIAAAVAIPRELHTHAPVLVGEDLAALGPGHDCALKAVHYRFGRLLGRPVWGIGENSLARCGLLRVVLPREREAGDQE